jgi:SAM-dependent methyltransferase
MESRGEADRLIAQERANPSHARLLAAGLAKGMRVADVGCGSGAVTSAMLEIVGPSGQVVGVDPAAERLASARALVGDARNVELRVGALPATGLEARSFDFVWCQYVFEYLAEPRPALDELIRLARPRGTVAVADIDGLGRAHWPAPPLVDEGFDVLVRALEKTGFDLQVGRKLFQLFRGAGLGDVRATVAPFYEISGAADARMMSDWRLRFDALRAVAVPEFGSAERYQAFCDAYLGMLADEDTFKYAVVITTRGTTT